MKTKKRNILIIKFEVKNMYIFSFNIRPLNVGFAVQISVLIWMGDKYVPNFHFFLGNISYLIFLKNYELVKSICINLHLILATLPDHWDILKSVKQSRLPLMNFNERKMVMLSIENWRLSSLSNILTIILSVLKDYATTLRIWIFFLEDRIYV